MQAFPISVCREIGGEELEFTVELEVRFGRIVGTKATVLAYERLQDGTIVYRPGELIGLTQDELNGARRSLRMLRGELDASFAPYADAGYRVSDLL